jgi:hypothetical protein
MLPRRCLCSKSTFQTFKVNFFDMKQFLPWIAVLCCGSTLAQTLDDGLMMPKKYFCTGFLYTHSQWDKYWEGSLKRDNQNIGTFSSWNIMYVGNYGITDRLNIIAMAPYISNKSEKVACQFLARLLFLRHCPTIRSICSQCLSGWAAPPLRCVPSSTTD